MLPLETNFPDMFVTTLKHHFEFIVKLLASTREKLSKIIAEHVIRNKRSWFRKWTELANEIDFELELSLNNLPAWSIILNNLLNKLHSHLMNAHRRQAESSTVRVCYPHLNHVLAENSYFKSNFSINKISTIFKTRGELLQLNYMPHRTDMQTRCTLCNLAEPETIIHFVGKCPILAEIRRVYFEKSTLLFNEICEMLNGKNWNSLYQFCKEATAYRARIIAEYL